MKKYLNLVFLLVLTATMSSCLKDKYNALDPENSPSVVEFQNPGFISTSSPAGSLYSMYTQSFVAAASTDVVYTIRLSGADSAPQDITVTVGADEAAVTKFNTDQKIKNPNWVDFTLLEADKYTIPQTSFVIPKGSATVNIVVSYKTNTFDFSKKYAFPLAIRSTSYGNVSSNFGTILINIGAKNAYDGIYKYNATSSLGNKVDNMLSVATVDLTTVTYKLINQYTNMVTVTVDPTTNVATVLGVNPGVGTPITNDAGNRYDPATKTFYLKWTAGARTFDEKLVYDSTR